MHERDLHRPTAALSLLPDQQHQGAAIGPGTLPRVRVVSRAANPQHRPVMCTPGIREIIHPHGHQRGLIYQGGVGITTMILLVPNLLRRSGVLSLLRVRVECCLHPFLYDREEGLVVGGGHFGQTLPDQTLQTEGGIIKNLARALRQCFV